MDLNKVMIIGRLTRDPEMRATPSGINVCQVSIATNYVYTNQASGQKVEQVEYHNIVLWRKLAEIANQYLKKGGQVYIEGRLQTRSWDAQAGTKKSRNEIVGDNMIMLGSASGSGTRSTGQSPMATPSNSSNRNEVVDAPEEELPTIPAGDDIKVEDIPF